MIRRVLKYNVLLFMVIIISALAGENAVEPAKGIPLFLKIITYDENFDKNNLDEIVILVLHDISRPKSYEQLLKVEKYFNDNKNIAVKGVKVKFKPVTHEQIDSAVKSVSNSNYNMILVTDIGDEKIKKLTTKIRDSRVRSFSFCPEYVPLGLSISVDPTRRSKAILVNLESSKQEGSKFSAHLLKICEIY